MASLFASNTPDENVTSTDTDRRVGVLLPLPLTGAYDYLVPAELDVAPGDFVEVPLGGRSVLGVVWGPAKDDVARTRLKAIEAKLETPPLPDISRRFIDWVANYCLSPPGAVLKMAMSVSEAFQPERMLKAYSINDPNAAPITAARRRVLDALAEVPSLQPGDLARAAGVTSGVIRQMLQVGLLKQVALPLPKPFGQADADMPGPILSDGQRAAADDLVQQRSGVTVLDGVTGSGKTEVYFEAIAACLKRGHQALVLLPEIALTTQWLKRFEDRFGAAPGQWHSELTGLERRLTWRAVLRGDAKVVVGARSALFLPFKDLGLIIVDEEHEQAFKQEDGVVYQARDMAVVRGHLAQIPVVLASATPSLETMQNVESERYRFLHLPDRHGIAQLPEVRLIDLRRTPPPKQSWLSPPLREAVKETLARKEQALLFLNRRGYAPLTLCRACGHRLKCPNCTAWLVEHRYLGRLQCHHCGFEAPLPKHCPACNAEGSMAACGPGVERVAEEAAALFPEASRMILTSDTASGPAKTAELLRMIAEREVDLVIGTQIIAKGHHFPNLTLVGVVDADLGLSGGDLRAAERTFQLLHQVSGRAGRADLPGLVLIQTYDPSRAVMRALAAGDRDQFYALEAEERKAAGMPPFGRLAAVILSGGEAREVDELAAILARTAPHQPGLQVLGPAPAPLAQLRGRHRRRFLVKARRDIALQPVLRSWLSGVKIRRDLGLEIDIDPYSFM
ncbi:MAG TPA: primosomal protein N' [Dongiaceae bacterium]|nr:primosomal protein N' [Dongiaceae bacterium]